MPPCARVERGEEVLVLRVTATVPLTFYYSICVVRREEVSAHHPVIILLRGVKWKSLFYSAVKGMIQSGGDHDQLHSFPLVCYASFLVFFVLRPIIQYLRHNNCSIWRLRLRPVSRYDVFMAMKISRLWHRLIWYRATSMWENLLPPPSV